MDDRHEHLQPVAATTWSIFHGLDNVANVDCAIDYDGVLQKALPVDMTHVSATQIDIVWSEAQSGRVSMLGKSSA